MNKDVDIQYLKMAIANSQRSFEEGRFPAGAVLDIVKSWEKKYL